MNRELTGGRLSRMPNQPATTIRGVRIPDELWEEAKAIAQHEGFASASEMVRDCLERRVAEHRRKHAQSGET
jgi:metal-responsive CopG/Arc/MetJ family transcriptional regulator